MGGALGFQSLFYWKSLFNLWMALTKRRGWMRFNPYFIGSHYLMRKVKQLVNYQHLMH